MGSEMCIRDRVAELGFEPAVADFQMPALVIASKNASSDQQQIEGAFSLVQTCWTI